MNYSSPLGYRPSYERLRAAFGTLRNLQDYDLLTLPPEAVVKMAAVVVASERLIQTSWGEEVEGTAADITNIPNAALAAPSLDDETFTKRNYRFREGHASNTRCSYCAVTPGKAVCSVCGSSGTTAGPEGPTQCWRCSGVGFERCTHCEGKGECLRARVVFVTEEVVRDRLVFAPSLIGTIDDAIGARLSRFADWPDELRLSLERRQVEAPYRGRGPAGDDLDHFEDYDLHDAAHRARAFVAANPAGVLMRRDRAWAVPFLCIRWRLEATVVDAAIVPVGAGDRWEVVWGPAPAQRA